MQNCLECINNNRLLCPSETRVDRKTDQPLVEGIADRKIAHAETHVSADRVVVDRDVVHLHADITVPERMKDRRAVLHSNRKRW